MDRRWLESLGASVNCVGGRGGRVLVRRRNTMETFRVPLGSTDHGTFRRPPAASLMDTLFNSSRENVWLTGSSQIFSSELYNIYRKLEQ